MATATIRDAEPANDLRSAFDHLHRFSVAEYHAMIESGIFAGARKVELLDGLVVEKMGQNPPHSTALRKILRLLRGILPEQYVASPQLPITLPTSEPEPDIAIILGPEELYDDRHPQPGEVPLIIEIADESLARDRRNKVRLYAASKIPEYWIVNLVDSTVEVHTKPTVGRESRYKLVQSYTNVQKIPLTLGGKKIADVSFRNILS